MTDDHLIHRPTPGPQCGDDAPSCVLCGEPYGPDPTGSPGVLVHLDQDGDVDHDRDRHHVPWPEQDHDEA